MQVSGDHVASLAWSGILLSTNALPIHRGLNKHVLGGHVSPRMPPVLILIFARPVASGAYDTYLALLLLANLASLQFDTNDLRVWFGGARRAHGHKRSV